MKMRIAIGQINSTVGDLKGNFEKMLSMIKAAFDRGARVIVFPELCVTGYPPEDLVLRLDFLKKNVETVEKLAIETRDMDIVIVAGFIDFSDDVYNAAAILYGGEIQGVYRKMILPNYGVFDEFRYFAKGRVPLVVEDEHGTRMGITICEDIWVPEGPMRMEVIGGNAGIIVNLSASPFEKNKPLLREKMTSTRARDYRIPIIYANLIGGQDELIFDGYSFAVDHEGNVIARAKGFDEDLLLVDIHLEEAVLSKLHDPRKRQIEEKDVTCDVVKITASFLTSGESTPSTCQKLKDEYEQVLDALILGTRDYIKKNGFQKVIVGLSGGIDSSLVASIATMALGPDNVVGVLMPSQFTSSESLEDARKLAQNLGIETFTIPIKGIFERFMEELEPVFKDLPWDVTEENLQARIRGNILMAISNKFKYLVLVTGNKSEFSVGYATLYGDMAGGFAVIKDLYKTDVYRVARLVNERFGREVIPERIFKKPPSAELRPGQVDREKLPPYEILDEILKMYIDKDTPIDKIIEEGFEVETVRSVVQMVNNSEYKRRQSPPGIKVSSRAFGKERRLPITNHYDPWK